MVFRERLEHEDREALRQRFARWPMATPVILEATFGWGWISDELAQAGAEVHLASSVKTAGWRKSRGLAKSNRIDADLLSELWDQKPRWWEVWLAPQGVRDKRELLRHRMGLVKVQTQTKNRIHALLHRHGILHDHADLFGKAGRRFLSQLSGKEALVRETARLVLKEELLLLDQLRGQIARASWQFRKRVKKDDTIRRLTSLPGVSTILAFTIAAEIGKIERFASSRDLLSYALLAPQANDSGEDREGKPIGRHLGHAGRQTLQWAFIEAAHGAVRKDALMKAVFNARTNNGTQNRNHGYIAVAHRLCRVTHGMWKHQSDYQAVPPRRPGAKESEAAAEQVRGSAGRKKTSGEGFNKSEGKEKAQSDSSPPGTGQLQAAMAMHPPLGRKRPCCK